MNDNVPWIVLAWMSIFTHKFRKECQSIRSASVYITTLTLDTDVSICVRICVCVCVCVYTDRHAMGVSGRRGAEPRNASDLDAARAQRLGEVRSFVDHSIILNYSSIKRSLS